MLDVARLAGVSAMTVSRVLQDRGRVAEDTSSRVRAAVGQLGYLRNDAARNLRLGRRLEALGVVVANLADPLFSRVVMGIAAAAEQYGLPVVLMNGKGDAARQARLANELISQGVEAVIIAPGPDDHFYLCPPQRMTPLVLIGRPPSGILADCVLVDDFGGIKEATSRFIARGHTRIAFIGPNFAGWVGAERSRGFRAAMAEADLHTYRLNVRCDDSDIGTAESTVRSVLAQPKPPTALILGNGRTTVAALRAAQQANSPVALAGFDDFAFAQIFEFPLSVVSYDGVELGRRAVSMAVERIRAVSEQVPPYRVVIPTVVTESGPYLYPSDVGPFSPVRPRSRR